jgi:hypothetical protein
MENVSYSKSERFSLEARWLDALMARNAKWQSTGPGARVVQARDRKVFVAWRLGTNGQPQVIDMLRVEDVSATFTGGLALELSATLSKQKLKVNFHPREIVPGVFAWIPPFAETRFCPFVHGDPESAWRLTLPMCVRTEAGRQPAPGQVQLSTAKEFRDLWPNVTL